MFRIKNALTWICIGFLITGCGGVEGEGESSGDSDDNPVADNGGTDTPGDDAITVDQPDSITGHFSIVDTTSSSRTSRLVSNTTVQLINTTGEVVASASTDGNGKFEFSSVPTLTSDDIPLHLSASSGDQTYFAPFVPQTGRVSANITDLSTAAQLYEPAQPISTLARLETVAQIILMNRFGVNELGNPNVSTDTFFTADLSSNESFANILIEVASQSGVNLLQDAPTGQPWMSNGNFVDALASALQNADDPSSALAEVSSQPGSSRFAATLTDMAEATTEEESDLNKANLIATIEETLATLQTRLQELIDELAQNPETPNDSSITVTALAIDGVSELNEQSSTNFTATVIYSDQTSQTVTVSWKIIGNGEAVIDSTGTMIAGEINASTTITLEASYGGKTATKNVLIKDTDATLVSIEIKGNSTIQEQATGQYTVTATYDDGTTQTVQPTWSENSVDAVIDSTGTLRSFEVASDNIVTLTASFNGKTATKNVLIENLTKEVLLLQINGVSEMDEQSTSTFSVIATYDDLSTATISPSWSVSSGGYAIIDSSGTVLAGQVTSSQAVTLTASFNGKTATKALLIRNLDKTVTGLAISGNTNVTEQSTSTYSSTATYEDGSTATVSPSWSVDGSGLATVDSGGVVTVGSVITDTTVTLTASFGGKTATKTLSIQNQTKTVLSLAVSGTASLDEATSTTFTAVATFDDNTSETVSPSWSVDGSGLATIDSAGLLTAATLATDTTVTVTAEYSGKSATKTVTLKDVNTPTTYTLSTGVTGLGTLTSNPTGIDCGSDCTEVFPENLAVTLTAAATTNYFFTGWSGDCTGTGDCGLVMSSDKSANATFVIASTLQVVIAGTGTVTDTTYNSSCTEDCTMTLPAESTVSLTATPGSGFHFNGWFQECAGTGTCSFTLANSLTVDAVFSSSQVELTNIADTLNTFFVGPTGMVFDSTNSKVLTVTSRTPSFTPILYRCDVDGSNCSTIDISAGQSGAIEGRRVLLDSTNSKLLLVAENVGNSRKPSLFRCDLDGSNCTHTDISAGRGTNSGLGVDAALDTVNSKLVAVARDGSNSNRLTLFRCDVDGSNCTNTDISLGLSSSVPLQVVVDTINSKLLTTYRVTSSQLGLIRCDLDGSNCSYTELTASESYVAFAHRSLLDTANAKLLSVSWHTNSSGLVRLSLLRCDLDGSNCTHTDISGGSVNQLVAPDAVLDLNRSKLIVSTYGNTTRAPAVVQCDLDGSNCNYSEIGAGYTQISSRMPLVIDTSNSRLLTVGGSFLATNRLYLHRLPLSSL